MPVDQQLYPTSSMAHASQQAMAAHHLRAAHESPLHIAHGRLAETWDDMVLGLPMGHSSSRFIDEPDHTRDHQIGISVGQCYAPSMCEGDGPFNPGKIRRFEGMRYNVASMLEETPREETISTKKTPRYSGYDSYCASPSSNSTLDGSSASEGEGLIAAFSSGLHIQAATKPARSTHDKNSKYSPYPKVAERRLRLRMDDLLNSNGRLDRRMAHNTVPTSKTAHRILATPVSGESSPSLSDSEQNVHRCSRRTVRQIGRCSCSDSEREEVEEMGREGDLEDFSEEEESDWEERANASSGYDAADPLMVEGESADDMVENEEFEWDDYLQEFRPRMQFGFGLLGPTPKPTTSESESTGASRRDGRRSSFTAM